MLVLFAISLIYGLETTGKCSLLHAILNKFFWNLELARDIHLEVHNQLLSLKGEFCTNPECDGYANKSFDLLSSNELK